MTEPECCLRVDEKKIEIIWIWKETSRGAGRIVTLEIQTSKAEQVWKQISQINIIS